MRGKSETSPFDFNKSGFSGMAGAETRMELFVKTVWV